MRKTDQAERAQPVAVKQWRYVSGPTSGAQVWTDGEPPYFNPSDGLQTRTLYATPVPAQAVEATPEDIRRQAFEEAADLAENFTTTKVSWAVIAPDQFRAGTACAETQIAEAIRALAPKGASS